jgi:hypothetical protein
MIKLVRTVKRCWGTLNYSFKQFFEWLHLVIKGKTKISIFVLEFGSFRILFEQGLSRVSRLAGFWGSSTIPWGHPGQWGT